MVRLAETRVPHENMTDFRRIQGKHKNSSGNESQCSSIKINVGMFTHCGFDRSIFLAAACSWCICEDNLPLKAKVARYYWAVSSRTASPSAVMYHLAMSSTREKNNTNSVHTQKKRSVKVPVAVPCLLSRTGSLAPPSGACSTGYANSAGSTQHRLPQVTYCSRTSEIRVRYFQLSASKILVIRKTLNVTMGWKNHAVELAW